MGNQSGIQGFYDPAPECPKMLRVRYDFRGRTHYAEIPDHVPVVLPLAGSDFPPFSEIRAD
jgi:DnaJ homolog subfamily C member 11